MNKPIKNNTLDADLFELQSWLSKNNVDSYMLLAVKDSKNYFYCRGYEQNPFDLINVLELELLNYKLKVLEALDNNRNKLDLVNVNENKKILQ
jgi:hypothetical protein